MSTTIEENLREAVSRGIVERTKDLVEKGGADVYAKDCSGNNALHLAAIRGEENIIAYLLQQQHGEMDIEIKGAQGLTALNWACVSGKSKAAQILLQYGADVHSTSDSGWMPLHWACCQDFHSVAQVLLQHGASPAAQTTSGEKENRSALDIAILHGSDRCARLLQLWIAGSKVWALQTARKRARGGNAKCAVKRLPVELIRSLFSMLVGSKA